MSAIRTIASSALEGLVHSWAHRKASRSALNLAYRSMSSAGRRWAHGRYAKLFRDDRSEVQPGAWVVEFVDGSITLPFSGTEMWLEWDAALAILGHETEVVDTYRALLQSSERPSTFVDVGTNYGLQSVLFLVHGVRTISFEPNPFCHPYFTRLCVASGVTPDVRRAALGDREGTAVLWFPETETWLGSIAPGTSESLAGTRGARHEEVEVTTLDAVLRDDDCQQPLLIKIDVEGHEAAVLRGARRTLERYRPMVILESHAGPARSELWDVLRTCGYLPALLPLLDLAAPEVLPEQGFLGSPASNFAALPEEDVSRRP